MQPLNKQFFKYPSIQNSYNTKAVSFTKKAPVAQNEIVWAALQKIHGANFSIECQNNAATYCRRKDFVSKPIPIPCQNVLPFFTEKFFNCQNLVAKFHNKLEDIQKLIAQRFPDSKKFYLFGQYFGGYWPGVMKQGISHVQRGIYYSPDHHFYIFDCLVADNRWLSVKELNEWINPIIPTIPVYKTGTFEQMLEIDAVFNSTIPALLGLQLDQKNTCQGVVIRPYQQAKHVIYKKKNDQFLQITNTPVPVKQKQQEKKFKQGQVLLKKLSTYLNVNRIESAYSKMPNAGIENLSNEVLNDIFDEAKSQDIKLLQGQAMNRTTRALKNNVCRQVAKYLKEVRGQNVEIKKQEKIQDILEEKLNLEQIQTQKE